MVIIIITLTGLLSVWFSEEGYGRRLGQAKRRNRRKKRLYARLALDEVLQKGTVSFPCIYLQEFHTKRFRLPMFLNQFFCSAGVEQDAGASLPYKLLMFGA